MVLVGQYQFCRLLQKRGVTSTDDLHYIVYHHLVYNNAVYQDEQPQDYIATGILIASHLSYRPFPMSNTRVGENGARKLSDIMRCTGHSTFVILPFLMTLFTSRCSVSQQ